MEGDVKARGSPVLRLLLGVCFVTVRSVCTVAFYLPCSQPLVALQLCVLARYRTTSALISVVLAGLLSQAIMLISVGLISAARLVSVRQFLKLLDGWRFNLENAESLLTPAMRRELTSIFHASIRRFAFLKDTLVPLFIFSLAKPAPMNAKRPTHLSSFPTSLGCFVFLTDQVGDISGCQRFYFLHELGHASKAAAYGMVANALTLMWIAFAIWVLCFSVWNVFTVPLLIICFIANYKVCFNWNNRSYQGFVLSDERAADQFAIEHVQTSDIEETIDALTAYPLPDPKLSPEDNAFRNVSRIRSLTVRHKTGVAKPLEEYPLIRPLRSNIVSFVTMVALTIHGQNVDDLYLWRAGTVSAIALACGLLLLTSNRFLAEEILGEIALNTTDSGVPSESPNTSSAH